MSRRRLVTLATTVVLVVVAVLEALAVFTGALNGAVAGRVTFSGGPPPGCDRCPVAQAPVRARGGGLAGTVVVRAVSGPGGGFRVSLPPGRYVVSSGEGLECSAAVIVLPGRTSSANLACGGP